MGDGGYGQSNEIFTHIPRDLKTHPALSLITFSLLNQPQVKSADTCNSYRKTLQRTEKKLADSRQENSFLKERIDIIASSTIVSSGKVRPQIT